jgi:hypothetical protein
MNIPARVAKKISENIKKYQPIIKHLKEKDVNESDTVTVIIDILSDVFGYDKYMDMTSEYAIKGTYCDLAIIDRKNGSKIKMIVEIKAIGISLNDNHVKQAVDYGANTGVNYIILTNGECWRLYKIKFGQPIDKELVYEFNILDINAKQTKDMDMLFAISKDGNQEKKSAIDDIYMQSQIKNQFVIGNIILQPEFIGIIKKEVRKIFSDVKITEEEIQSIVRNKVVKNEIIVGEETDKFRKMVEKGRKKIEKIKTKISEQKIPLG